MQTLFYILTEHCILIANYVCRSRVSKETDGSECSGSQTEPGGNHVQPARGSAQPEVSENQHMFMAWKITAKLIHKDANCCFSMNRKSGRKHHNVLWKHICATKSMNINKASYYTQTITFSTTMQPPTSFGRVSTSVIQTPGCHIHKYTMKQFPSMTSNKHTEKSDGLQALQTQMYMQTVIHK